MNYTVRLGHLEISDAAKDLVRSVLDSNRLSYGPYTRQFEEEFATLHDCKHAIFLNSGTSALQVALEAVKEKYGYADGTNVLVPAVTFISTVNVVLQARLTPMFVDVSPKTFNMDLEKAEARMRSVSAAIPVHLFGLPCDWKDYWRAGVIEDSCESMFVSAHGKKVGSMGDFGCFSTYVCHLITTGVGGIITCQDDADAKLCRSIMQHGRDDSYLSIDDIRTDDPAKFKQIVESRYRFVRMGYSYRNTEMEAALGVAALAEHKPKMEKRAKIVDLYHTLLDGNFTLQETPMGVEHANMLFPVVLGTFKRQAPEGVRDRLMLHLETNGIETRTAMPLLNQPYYRDLFGDIEKDYPVAAWMNRCGLCLPCHDGMTGDDVARICELIVGFLGREAWRR